MQVTRRHAQDRLPHALEQLSTIVEQVGGRDPAFFLDFDGTLSPIAPRPDLACLPSPTRTLLASLGERHVVCILSGRTLEDLTRKVAVPGVFYGADHGRHIIGPDESGIEHVVGAEARGDLRSAARLLRQKLADIEGVIVEEKDLSLSVHYRLTPETHRAVVARRVEGIAAGFQHLALGRGKMVHELRPRDGWDKGQAMLWLLERLGLIRSQTCPVCLGDDLTDEDMFRALDGRGIAIVVGSVDRPTLAQYVLADACEAAQFLGRLDVALVSRGGHD